MLHNTCMIACKYKQALLNFSEDLLNACFNNTEQSAATDSPLLNSLSIQVRQSQQSHLEQKKTTLFSMTYASIPEPFMKYTSIAKDATVGGFTIVSTKSSDPRPTSASTQIQRPLGVPGEHFIFGCRSKRFFAAHHSKCSHPSFFFRGNLPHRGIFFTSLKHCTI